MMFYSLVGPKSSEFKINELKMEVYVRDVGKTEATKLVCDSQIIKKSRQLRKLNIVEEKLKTDFQSEKYVLTSIKGSVKWKATWEATALEATTKATTLKLKLFQGEDTFAKSEITLAEIKVDASSGDFTEEDINIVSQEHLKNAVFMPRPQEEGDTAVLEVQVPGWIELEIEKLEATVISEPYFETAHVDKPILSSTQKRKIRAFVVGISKYTALGELNNAVHDSRGIVESLKDHGVPEEDIISAENCHIFALNEAFHRFVELCSPGDLAFIFFAGHGCAFKNYQCLLARALSENERKQLNNSQYQLILESSLQVNVMLAKLKEKGVDQHVLLLDCCREFRTENLSRSTKDDELKDVKPAPFNVALGQGTTIGYATAPGDFALEPKDKQSSDCFRGATGHGYYTEALLKHMHKINTDVDYMLREVGKEVHTMSKGQQNPYRSSCLNEPDAYLFSL